MNEDLLGYLVEPGTGSELTLEIAKRSDDGRVWEGVLHSPTRRYPIVRGIPRFVDPALYESVRAFGDEWNSFDFIDFKQHWLNHMVANTFGSTAAFKSKVIVEMEK